MIVSEGADGGDTPTALRAVTVKWIAERLQMGAPGYVNLLLHRPRQKGKAKYVNIKTRLGDPFMVIPVF